MKCPRCQQENPLQAKFCLACGAPVGVVAVTGRSHADLRAEIESLKRSLSEASEQQTATSEILRVISSSLTDTQPAFDTIAATALRLCNAKLCTVFRFDGKLIHLVALHQVSTEGAAAYRDAYPAPPGRAGGTHRAILTRSIVHIPDIREDPEYELQALARANDFGCVLSVPMAPGRTTRWSDYRGTRGRTIILGRADRVAQDLRFPGPDRDRERKTVQRDEGGA